MNKWNFIKKLILCCLLMPYFSLADHAVLILTDIHFTPFYGCADNGTDCPQLEKLIAAPSKQWPQILSAEKINTYREETNNAFLMQGLNSLVPIAKQYHVKTIFILGDLISHDFPMHYKKNTSKQFQNPKIYNQFVEKTLLYVLNQIHQNFPKAKIYFVLGNNDSDTGDYNLPSKNILKLFFKGSNSYFTTNLFNNVELIGLNSNLIANNHVNTPLATQQLTWLATRLAKAQQQGKKIIILQHIPYGIFSYPTVKTHNITPLLDPNFQKQYLNLLNQYSTSILDIYSAHLHMEYFSLINQKTPVIGTIAFNAFIGNKPGFKILILNDDGSLQNFFTYVTSLNSNKIQWQLLYNFNYNYLDANSLPLLLSDFPTDMTDQRVINYRQFYNGGNSLFHEPISEDKDWKYYYCAIAQTEVDDYANCLLKMK